MSVYPSALPTVRPAVRSAFEQGSSGGAASIIAGLFAQGQQGFWLPFTDFASLSQDSAGTLPYTAIEQPVGRVLDRSGRGNHATQVTSTARGVVSARVNMLTNSEFTGFVTGSPGTSPTGWGRGFSTGTVASDGTFFNLTTAGGRDFITQDLAGQLNTEYVMKARIKVVSGAIRLADLIGTNAASPASQSWYVNGVLASGETSIGAGSYDIEWRCLYTSEPFKYRFAVGCGVQVNTTVSVTFYSASVTTAAKASLPYQRVNTASDYDSVGFPKYLRLDGTDDFYTCGGGGSTTGFYYSDVLSVVSGSNGMLFDVVDAANAAYRTYVLFNAYNQLIVSFTSGSGTFTYTTTAALTGGAMSSVQLWYDGSLLSIQMGSGTIETFAAVGPNQTGSVIHLYRHKFAAVNYFNGKVTEPIFRVGPPPNAYEREVIRNYQKQKAGML